MRPSLTLEAIKTSLPGDVLYDDTVRGLHLRVGARRRTYYLYFRTKAGLERRPRIEDHGVITLNQARDIAREMLGSVAAGRDPVAERAAAKAGATVDAFFSAYWEKNWQALGSGREIKRRYIKYAAPKVGTKRVRDVTEDDVQAIHTGLKATPYQANRVVDDLATLFDYAERPKVAERAPGTNPCGYVERYTELKRKVFAKPEDIAKVGPALIRWAEERPAEVAFIYIMIFSGARPSEVERFAWPQLERVGEAGVIRMHGKTTDVTGEQRDVFLPPQAMRVIDRLPRTATGPIVGVSKAVAAKFWRRIRKETGVRPDLWMRDWRRTFGVTGLSKGVSAGAVGELLGHASAQTTKIYTDLFEDAAHAAAGDTAAALEKMLTSVPSPT